MPCWQSAGICMCISIREVAGGMFSGHSLSSTLPIGITDTTEYDPSFQLTPDQTDFLRAHAQELWYEIGTVGKVRFWYFYPVDPLLPHVDEEAWAIAEFCILLGTHVTDRISFQVFQAIARHITDLREQVRKLQKGNR